MFSPWTREGTLFAFIHTSERLDGSEDGLRQKGLSRNPLQGREIGSFPLLHRDRLPHTDVNTNCPPNERARACPAPQPKIFSGAMHSPVHPHSRSDVFFTYLSWSPCHRSCLLLPLPLRLSILYAHAHSLSIFIYLSLIQINPTPHSFFPPSPNQLNYQNEVLHHHHDRWLCCLCCCSEHNRHLSCPCSDFLVH